jgi:hypothetical protein
VRKEIVGDGAYAATRSPRPLTSSARRPTLHRINHPRQLREDRPRCPLSDPMCCTTSVERLAIGGQRSAVPASSLLVKREYRKRPSRPGSPLSRHGRGLIPCPIMKSLPGFKKRRSARKSLTDAFATVDPGNILRRSLTIEAPTEGA